ncbi:glycosyltransferase [Lachnospiraceae bacterium MD1]|jgi:glycosyltransferase involved in cell wall biosynthesis|uniref:Glycosyltransferase n=1 Tax=Variimorphobacter saccharofermentans TaxID=2755051 RepID=A0A839K423_9FIRM|nr:glycosyltransferase [Variimorphobacter saccharofermentans]MBB2183431.1 glycosyltransferase [Variimorphobacter saccharofermentans]
MKILHINAVSGIRSTGRICSEIIEFLNDNGHKGYIAYSDGIKARGYKIGNKFDRKCHALLSRITGKQGYFSVLETYRLLKYIELLEPDIIHLHNLHGNYINIIMLLRYITRKNIPTVLTLHDCWFFTGKCFHFTVTQCYKWKEECNHCPRIHRDNPSWFFDKSRKMYHDKRDLLGRINHLAVVGVSDWITEEAKQSLLGKAKIITRIYNWVDFNVYKPVDTEDLRRSMGLSHKFMILGVASFWTVDKGLFEFLRLSKQLPEYMVIVLIGNMKDNLEAYKNIVHIRETHDVNSMVKFYSMADVLLNLSMEEACGRATIEALACGTPVIAMNSTSNPEQIGDGCGYVVDENNREDLFEKINQVYRNTKSYYSKHCIHYANENFNKTKCLNEYSKLYHELSGGEAIHYGVSNRSSTSG